MNLLDSIRIQCAVALNSVHAIIPDEAEAQISIVVSHKGQVADSLLIGDHDPAEILAIAVHMGTEATLHVGEVDADGYTHQRVQPPSSVQ